MALIRGENGQFLPGSVNPDAGRPQLTEAQKDVKHLAKTYTVDAMNTLVEICTDDGVPPHIRVDAANAILDRGHGKPTVKQELPLLAEGQTGYLEFLQITAIKATS